MFKPFANIAAAAVLVLAVTGCATAPTDPAARAEFEQANDPFEPANRYFFEVNRFLDFIAFRPISDIYRTVVPELVRKRVDGVLANMGEPLTAGNTLLQGRFNDTGTTVARFAVNSVLGVGGMFDVASDFGLEEQRADFGQTLYTYGVDSGPYLVLPVFGPSNFRDAVGMGVDSVADPVGIAFSAADLPEANYSRAGVAGISQRSKAIEQLDTLEKTSVDFYSQMRSIMQQRRNAQLRGERVADYNYDIYSID